MEVTTSALLDCMIRLGYSMRTEPNIVNPIGIRTADMTPNSFNDFLCALWMDEFGIWNLKSYKCTTDPGLYWLQHPMNTHGTAIVKPGHYKASHVIGLHKGWEALVQSGPLAVYRDANRDGKYDFDENNVEVGSFAIDIHRASPHHASAIVDKWSAGCQVVASPEDHKEFMQLCRDGSAKNFDYTLITEKDLT